MWMLFNMLTSPLRSTRMWVIGLGVGLVLLLALANAGPDTQGTLGQILGAAVVLLVIRVPMRLVLTLMFAAVVIVSAVSLVREVLASGYVPVAITVLMLASVVTIGVRAGGLQGALWSDLVRQAFRGPPRSRGAHFATLRELRRAGFLGPHGYPLGSIEGHTIRLPEKRQREGVLVTAPTGSGKSSALVIPALMEEASRPAEKRSSIVVLDPKDAELCRTTMPTLATTHRVLVCDPSDPDASNIGLDPLATLPASTDERLVGECKQLAQAFFWSTRGGEQTTDPFWVNLPKAIMECLFLAFVTSNPKGTFVELATWARSLKIAEFQNLLDQSAHPSVRASAETLRSLGMSERTIGPGFADVLQRFDLLDDPRVCRAMAGPPVDWPAFFREPTALYLRVGAQDAQRLAPLLSLAIGQLYRELTRAAAQCPGHRLPRGCQIIIDEFGNLPRIYGIETALATLRSAGVGHLLLVQSSVQIAHHYGEKLAHSIQDNLNTRIVMGGASDADAKAFSQRAGEITEFHPTRSWSGRGLLRAGSENFSHAPERRPLVSAAEIIHMRDELLVSSRAVAPFRLTAQPYYADPATVRRLETDKVAYEQRVPAGTPPQIEPSSTSAAPEPDRGNRDVPPPGCSEEEWNAAADSLRAARWSMEDSLFWLVTGRMTDLDHVREFWRTHPSRSSQERYARITPAERAKSPAVAAYVDELALRLELRHEVDEPPAAM
jgi:type IV secretory pathway TraG/TraD family ATPase VirD4